MELGCKIFTSTGCCFVKFATSEEADRAIRALHNQVTLPGVRSVLLVRSYLFNLMPPLFEHPHVWVFQGLGPIQVRYADGERERLGNFPSTVRS